MCRVCLIPKAKSRHSYINKAGEHFLLKVLRFIEKNSFVRFLLFLQEVYMYSFYMNEPFY